MPSCINFSLDRICRNAYYAGMSQTTELIKRLRAAGLTQTEIARRSGIPQPRVSRWENGEAPDSADDALRLAQLVSELPEVPEQPKAA